MSDTRKAADALTKADEADIEFTRVAYLQALAAPGDRTGPSPLRAAYRWWRAFQDMREARADG